MAYTREAISDTPSAVPTQIPATMKEEAVFDPYGKSKMRSSVMGTAIGQSDTVGDKKAVETSPPAETVTLSPQVAALARQQQKFRQQEQALKDREKALEEKNAKLSKLEALEAKLAVKDYSGIEELVNYEEYADYLLNKQSASTPEQQALKKLEAQVAGMETAQKTKESKQFDAAVNERRMAVNKLVETNEEFASIKELKQQEAVVQHILDTWEHDSKELTVEEASKEVEELLVERATKWAGLTKLKTRTEPVDEKKQLPPLKQGLKTITNQVTAGALTAPVKSFQHMNESERYAEARRRAVEKLDKQRGSN